MNRKIRLVLADNHQFVTDACRQMLGPEFEVADVAVDGRALVKSAIQLKPDGVILEVALPQLNGIDVARQLKLRVPMLKLIFLSANSDVNVAAEAFRAGASGYVLKRSGAQEFVAAVRRVMRGESYLSPLIARETIDYLLRSPDVTTSRPRITAREAEILQLLAEGSSMKQVAAVLGITSGTVAFHKYKMMERLGIESNAGLIQYAMSMYMTVPQSGWVATRGEQRPFMLPPEETEELLPLLRGNGEGQRQLRGHARMRRRPERAYAADIQ